MASGTTLLAFDTDRIKQYVFATDQLREIRGASALLDQLNRETMWDCVREADPNAVKVYANGGAGLFVVDGVTAGRAQQAVLRAYRERTGGAGSVTAASVDIPASIGFGDDSAQDAFRTLQFRLRRAKDCPPPALAVSSLPFIRPCDACGSYPAAGRDQREPDRLICGACCQRQQGGNRLWSRLLGNLDSEGRAPGDFSEIGAMRGARNYLALLYADGNGMGREMERLGTLEEFTGFANRVDEAITDATRDAIRAHLLPQDGVFPFLPLLLGGDDLVMVIHPRHAIDAAITLAEAFAARTCPKVGGNPLSLSVGVVFAHAHFPFRTLLDIAESALKFAKTEGARRELKDRSLINFLAISNSNHLDFGAYYSQTLTTRSAPQGPERVRTLRPYTPAGLRQLVNAARKLQGASRTRLHSLRECVFASGNRSIMDGLGVLHRWRAGGNHAAGHVQVVLDLVNNLAADRRLFPWAISGQTYRTPVLDLAELFDFVQEQPIGNS